MGVVDRIAKYRFLAANEFYGDRSVFFSNQSQYRPSQRCLVSWVLFSHSDVVELGFLRSRPLVSVREHIELASHL